MCLSLLGGIVVGLLVAGCASIIHGTKQEIAVSSIPTGAEVSVRGVHMATTPSVIKLKRKNSNIAIRFEKEGYEPVEIALRRSTDGWIVGNILFGGLIGLAVDFIDGAAYKLTPAELNAVLEKQGISVKDLPKDGVIVAVDLREIRQ